MWRPPRGRSRRRSGQWGARVVPGAGFLLKRRRVAICRRRRYPSQVDDRDAVAMVLIMLTDHGEARTVAPMEVVPQSLVATQDATESAASLQEAQRMAGVFHVEEAGPVP